MLKKLRMFLCLSAFMAWPALAAQDDDDFDESGFVSADGSDAKDSTAAPKAASADDDDEEEFSEADQTAGMTRAQKEDYEARKKFEDDQRADEYANSERRRDWLKDRLMLEVGMGSRYPIMGETGMGMGLGIGAEYITRWHIGLYGSVGWLPKGDDNAFEGQELEGGMGYKVGINYYLFPKNPLHLGISASYGTVYFDHNVEPDENGLRPLIMVNGYQFDALIAYMTNEWYYLQFSFGMYYSPELGTDTPEDNPSLRYQSEGSSNIISAVEKKKGMDKTGLVFGIAVGYAFPEFFPDDTEKRRRQREKERKRGTR